MNHKFHYYIVLRDSCGMNIKLNSPMQPTKGDRLPIFTLRTYPGCMPPINRTPSNICNAAGEESVL